MADMICPDTKCRYYNTDETNHCKKHKHCGVYCTYRFTGDLLCPACIPSPWPSEPQPLEELIAKALCKIDNAGCLQTQEKCEPLNCPLTKESLTIIMQAITEQEQAELQAMREALQWCSGSADFQEGGQARKGWLKICKPLL